MTNDKCKTAPTPEPSEAAEQNPATTLNYAEVACEKYDRIGGVLILYGAYIIFNMLGYITSSVILMAAFNTNEVQTILANSLPSKIIYLALIPWGLIIFALFLVLTLNFFGKKHATISLSIRCMKIYLYGLIIFGILNLCNAGQTMTITKFNMKLTIGPFADVMSIFIAIAWVGYFKQSERVKGTFVR